MTRDKLIDRLKGYEWADFECKRAQHDVPRDAYSTVSAFANTQGGWLLFGVSENAGRVWARVKPLMPLGSAISKDMARRPTA